MIAISTLGAFLDNLGSAINPWGGKGSLYFGMFAIIVSWIVVMVTVVVFVTGLHEKVTVINWPLTVGIKYQGNFVFVESMIVIKIILHSIFVDEKYRTQCYISFSRRET